MKNILSLSLVCFFALMPTTFAALATTTVWEFRATATNQNNSAGFNPSNASPGTDYSQQDNSQYNFADLASSNATTSPCVVTSASHNFVAADNGNIINIVSGTNWTSARYEIVSTSANAATLDRACGAAASVTAGTYRVGGAFTLNSSVDDAMWETFIGGNKIWIKSGSYAFGQTISVASASCTAIAPCLFEGYNATRGDKPTGSNRPLLAAAANSITFGSFENYVNIQFTSTATSGILIGAGSKIANCKFLNTSTTATRFALAATAANISVIASELISQNGTGINAAGATSLKLYGNYFHDSLSGISSNSASIDIVGNIFEGMDTSGVVSTGTGTNLVADNTFYGREAKVGIGLNLNVNPSPNNLVINNIFYGLASGITVLTAAQGSNFDYYNDYFNNTADTTLYAKGTSALALDPQFTGASQITGTTATSTGSTLTQSGGAFGTVTDNVDVLHVISGTGVTVANYLITGHTTTTLTTNNALGTSSAGNIVYYITVGHDFSIGTNLKAAGIPGPFGTETTSYLDTGAAQRQETGGGAATNLLGVLQ